MKTKISRLSGFVAAAAMFEAPISQAAFHDFTTTIYVVGTADPVLWGNFDYILLDNVSSAGSCVVDPSSGKVLIVLPTQKSYAMALAAKLAGHQVRVSLDDTRKDSYGNCIMRWMQVLP